MAQCLTPDCTNDAKWRGVCWGCRDRVRRSVAAGQITEGELMRFGLLKQLVTPKGRAPKPSVYNDLDKLADVMPAPSCMDISGHVVMNPDGSFTFVRDESNVEEK